MSGLEGTSWIDGLRRAIAETPAAGPTGERYQIVERVGEGTAAVVYRAVDRELGRPVALKVLRETFNVNPVVRQRFQREAQAAAGLSHPNLVTLYDQGEAGGRLFLVMEFVEGQPLSRGMAGRNLPLRRLIEILEKAARGVGAAHEKGIVHRDLKPANIIVGRDGEPKVADFGLAHLAGETSDLTRTGMPVGTPLYMSPEQVRGESVSPRSDVYSLGAILYEMVTGRPPHVAATAGNVYAKILNEEPSLPSRLQAHVSGDLQTVIMKAIEKDPGRRYADARDFADELRRYLDGEPVHARPVARMVRAWRRWRRRRAMLPVAAALLALAAWAIVASVRDAHRVRLTLDGAHRLESDGDLDAALKKYEVAAALDPANARAWRGYERVSGVIRQAQELRDRARERLTYTHARWLWEENSAADALGLEADESVRLLEDARRIAPRLQGLQFLLGRAWEIKGWPDRAEECWRRETEVAGGWWSAQSHLALARLLRTRAFFVGAETEWLDFESGRTQALALAEESHVHTQQALSGLGESEDVVDRRLAEALLRYAETGPDAAGAMAKQSAEELAGRSGVEDFYWLAGLVASGERRIELLEKALRLRPRNPVVLVSLAVSRRHAREAAIELCTRAIMFDPRFAEAYGVRAQLLKALGRYDDALADCDKVIETAPHRATAFYARGHLHEARGRFDAALPEYNRAIELDPQCWSAYLQRAKLRRGSEDAREDLDRLRSLDARTAPGLILRGEAWMEEPGKDLNRAVADLTNAIALNPNLEAAYFQRAWAHYRNQQYAEALDDAEHVLKVAPQREGALGLLERVVDHASEETASRARRMLEQARRPR